MGKKDDGKLHVLKTLPARLLVRPHIVPIDEERDAISGHVVSGGGFIFEESGADHILFRKQKNARAWLAERGYQFESDLENGYMAYKGFHGVWRRQR